MSHVTYMSRCCCWYDITLQKLNGDTYATSKNSQNFVGLDVALSCSVNAFVTLSRGSINGTSMDSRVNGSFPSQDWIGFTMKVWQAIRLNQWNVDGFSGKRLASLARLDWIHHESLASDKA